MAYLLMLLAGILFLPCAYLIGIALIKNTLRPPHIYLAIPIGAAVIVLISSCFFVLRLSPWISVFLIGATVLASAFYARDVLFDALSYLPCLLGFFAFTALLVVLPFVAQHGLNRGAPGYMVCNDSVIHALLARGFEENGPIQDKLYHGTGRGGEPSIYNLYPIGAHSLVNLVAFLTGRTTDRLVFDVSLYFVALGVFPALFLFWILFLSKRSAGSHLPLIAIPVTFCVASYYALAISYHGFLSQSVYVLFTLSSILLLVYNYQDCHDENDRVRTLPLAVLIAAAISVYVFAGIIPLVYAGLFSLRCLGGQRRIKDLVLIAITTLILLTSNNLIILAQIRPIFCSFLGGCDNTRLAQRVTEETGSLGNLVEFLNPLMLTGVWFEPDYRLQTGLGVFPHIGVMFSVLLLILGGYGLFRNNPGRKTASRLCLVLALSYATIVVLTKSPYAASKILSLCAPVIAFLALCGLLRANLGKHVRLALVVSYMVAICASNQILIKHISVLPREVLTSLQDLSKAIGDKTAVIFSDNDWLLYYVDSPKVDITNLHYLPDIVPQEPQPYDYAVFDGNHPKRRDYNCLEERIIHQLSVCRLR